MAGGGGGQAGEGASMGTEYTLQGVMRFLQTEWHRHERDRNAWEIERAEMKSRIGRLEGEARTSKRSSESLSKYVKILEIALRKEREKIKSLANGEKVDLQSDPKEQAKEALNALPQSSIISSDNLDPETGGPSQSIAHQDGNREKSRVFLSKYSSEVTYHVIPSTHPPPDLADIEAQAQDYSPIQPPSRLEEAYAQQQKQQHTNNLRMLREAQMAAAPATEQTESEFADTGLTRSNTQINHALPIREHPEKANNRSSSPITAIDNRKPAFEIPSASDEQVESISHTYDAYGKPVASREEVEVSRTSEQAPPEMSDGWDFDDGPTANEPVPEQLHHRPDTDAFPSANLLASKSPTRASLVAHRRKSSGAKRRSSHESGIPNGQRIEGTQFKVRFALRGHLDVVRSVIFTGGGTPAEPEIATCGDDGTIKRWIIPASYSSYGVHQAGTNDLDITSYFTHRGHSGAVTALASAPASQNFSNGGRALGDGWIFSGGQDSAIKVWERGRVDPKASLDGHTDAVWALCVLPGTSGSILGDQCSSFGGPDRILLVSGGADGRILIWAVSAPPQLTSPHSGSNRGARASRRANSVSSGSNFPSSPQPSTATSTPFHFTLVHHIARADSPSPTCISPLSPSGDNFVVSFTDASILIFDTRTGEEVVGMASLETYDGTPSTGVNSVVASTIGFDGALSLDHTRGISEESEGIVSGATGSREGVEGVIISGYEDRYVRFFDANSGQCTYTMIAHTSAISSLSLSPDGRELVSAGHDSSLRFWSLEKRSCTQEITSHRLMRGEGVCSVVWSQDGRWVVSGGGDGVVKVFAR